MRIVFAGSDIRSPIPFRALREAGFCVVAVVTQPDKPVGRKQVLTPNPVKCAALEAGVPVYTFAKIREHAAELAALGADCMVTCAYGQLLTEEVLAAFPRGVFNVHTSLLPRWRGASPVQSAILAGDAETGVTVMRTELGLDTGDVLLRVRIPVSEEDTAGTLADKLFALGADCIVAALSEVEAGTARYEKQNEAEATFCKKIKKEDAAVDFSAPAQEICRLVRAMAPEPLAHTRLGGVAVNVLAAYPAASAGAGACGSVARADKTGIYVRAGDGCVCIRRLQFAGGKPLSAADAVNGRKVSVGDVFESAPQGTRGCAAPSAQKGGETPAAQSAQKGGETPAAPSAQKGEAGGGGA